MGAKNESTQNDKWKHHLGTEELYLYDNILHLIGLFLYLLVHCAPEKLILIPI